LSGKIPLVEHPGDSPCEGAFVSTSFAAEAVEVELFGVFGVWVEDFLRVGPETSGAGRVDCPEPALPRQGIFAHLANFCRSAHGFGTRSSAEAKESDLRGSSSLPEFELEESHGVGCFASAGDSCDDMDFGSAVSFLQCLLSGPSVFWKLFAHGTVFRGDQNLMLL
jgi:hypothetical protein